jgi:hypothetical protein
VGVGDFGGSFVHARILPRDGAEWALS